LQPSDIIAVSAIVIAVGTTVIQYIYESIREWHTACEILFRSMDSLFTELKELVENPNKTNHISYQQYLNQRKHLLNHYSKRFFLYKNRIRNALYIVVFHLMDIPVKVEYEELMNKGIKNKKKQKEYYFSFINEIRDYTAKASEALINENPKKPENSPNLG
jgi:hypothetical protein